MSKIRKMLDECASGYSIEKKEHKQWVRYNEKTYHLPKGEHSTKDPEIEKGHIKRMVNHLEICLECAKQYLPILK